MWPYKIAVLGLWHLGEIYSAGLSDLGHQVVGLSEDESLISNFQKNIPPLPEPNLEETLKNNQAVGRLTFSADFSKIEGCDVLWVTFDTPVNNQDEVDLTLIWSALGKSLPHLKNQSLIIISSQIPVGTSNKICEFINQKRPDLNFDYIYSPENLRLGEALECFKNPGRIVFGAFSSKASEKFEDILSGLKTEFIEMSPVSAEMSKHAINAFLATSVSFINDLSDLSEKVGADIIDVSRALKSEPRIGPKAFLSAGIGFAGGTLGRDLQALIKSAKDQNISLPVIESIYEKNKNRAEAILNILQKNLGDFKNKKISILGLTYKPGTRTLRRSRSLEIALKLKNLGARLSLCDPQVDEKELASFGDFDFSRDPYQAVANAEAVIVATPWPEFRDLDFQKLKEVASSNAIIFDTSNFFLEKESIIKKVGFIYLGIGRK